MHDIYLVNHPAADITVVMANNNAHTHFTSSFLIDTIVYNFFHISYNLGTGAGTPSTNERRIPMTENQQKLYDFLKSKGGSAHLMDCAMQLDISDEELQLAVNTLVQSGIISKDAYVQPTLRII